MNNHKEVSKEKIHLSLVIPVFNERSCLVELHGEIQTVLQDYDYSYETIFVDDGSTDGSCELIKELSSKDPSVKSVHLKKNYGQTAALMAGFKHADGDIIVSLDGDLQNDPADIPKLLEKIHEGYDVCSGWRKKRKDSLIRRRLMSFFANFIVSILSGVKLHDFGCTLKAYRSEYIQGVRLYGEMHRFIPIYLHWEGAKLSEVPVNHRPRTRGKSKYGLERTFKVMLDLIVIVFIGRYMAKPIYFFGAFGLANVVLSLCAFALAVWLKFFGGKTFIETPLPLICVMFMMTGILCILMGLLAEVLMRTYFETQGKNAYFISHSYRKDNVN
ncbi:MAG: glycosyltransferase [Acidobacteria bacterium]|nr:MAG: glycosyltransferase [Acidobacteriota bacterium]